jgi:hypothetical protein
MPCIWRPTMSGPGRAQNTNAARGMDQTNEQAANDQQPTANGSPFSLLWLQLQYTGISVGCGGCSAYGVERYCICEALWACVRPTT